MPRKFCCSLATLEEIAVNPVHNRELYTLLGQHDCLVLDATAAEVDDQLADSGSILAAALRILGSTVDEQTGWQQNPDKFIASEATGALFVLDQEEAECERLRQKFGVCVVNQRSAPSADYLTKALVRKELTKFNTYSEMVSGSLRLGWHAALTVPELPIANVPLNSLIIIDTYLFGDKGRFANLGKENLVNLLKALLPPSLEIDFHLLLIAANSSVPFGNSSFDAFTQEIAKRLARPYKIQIGLLTRPPGGKERRSITSNYYFCTSQHGFACFKDARPDYNNDFVASGAFEGADSAGFDTPVRSMLTELKTVKYLLANNQALSAAPGTYTDPNRSVLGFCENRLLQLV